MAKTTLYDVAGQDLAASLASFFHSMLELDEIGAIMVPLKRPGKDMVMQELVVDPEKLGRVDPFAPAFPMNAARLVSRLTRKSAGETIVVVLRPCEIRAYIELAKLKQGDVENVVIVGIDCPGAFGNIDYKKFAQNDPETSTMRFLEKALDGETAFDNGIELSTACRACTHPVAESADLMLGIFGLDWKKQYMIASATEKGDGILDRLQVTQADVGNEREKAIESLLATRTAFRDEMFEKTSKAVAEPEKLASWLEGCINCYNCRVACPVCYCRECVFVTDVFDHDPYQYLRWAHRKGKIRMPTDTVFYHLTRMVHMSTACVGCGQCSNACPNDIPLVELFTTTAHQTQAAFDYEAGRSLTEEPPLAVFKEEEFTDVTDIKH